MPYPQAPAFRLSMTALPRHLALLTALYFAASLALRMLMMNLKDQQGRGQDLRLFGLQPQIADVFRKTRFDTLFTIADDEEAGLAGLKQ